MKTHIWNCTETFPSKVNFVDTDDVLLGYDLGQDCCENAFWTISTDKEGKQIIHQGEDGKPKDITLDGYRFDIKFFEREDNDGEECYVAIFKLIGSKWDSPELPDLYIRLENHHNGYYSHGFVFKANEIISGSL